MSRTAITPSAVRLTLDPPSRINTDLLVIPLFEGESAIDTIPSLDSATAGELRRATESGELSARPFEFFTTPLVDGAWRARRVAFVGAGRASDATPERLRKLATAVGMLARQRRHPAHRVSAARTESRAPRWRRPLPTDSSVHLQRRSSTRPASASGLRPTR